MSAPLGKQLKMFMSAREIGEEVSTYGDFGTNPGGLPHETFRSKSAMGANVKDLALDKYGMRGSVQRDGVKKPIQIMHREPYRGESGTQTELWDGHHRVQAQSQSDPDRLIPVQHLTQEHYRAYNNRFNFHSDPTGDKL